MFSEMSVAKLEGSISCANPTPGANFANPNYIHRMHIQPLEEEMRLINT
jgi:hypothetical protein